MGESGIMLAGVGCRGCRRGSAGEQRTHANNNTEMSTKVGPQKGEGGGGNLAFDVFLKGN